MSAAAAIPITSAVNPVQFIRYRVDQGARVGKGPALTLEKLEYRANLSGPTFDCKSRWLEITTGFCERQISRHLNKFAKAGILTWKRTGRGRSITFISQAKTADKTSDLIGQNVRSENAPSINLLEEEKPKNSNSTAAAAAVQSEKAKSTNVTAMPDPEAVAELTQRGVWPSVARKLTREFGKEQVLAAIAYTAQAAGVRELPNFLVAAVRDGWKVPPIEPAPAPAMRTCRTCGEFFDSKEGWYDGKCSRCEENSEGLRWPAGKLHESMEGTDRQIQDGRQTLHGQSPRTHEVQRIESIGPRIDATVPKESKLPVDASCSPGRVEPQTTTVSGARGRPAAVVWEPKCRKCGLPITAERLGTHGMHFACDEWSRG